MLFAYSLKQTGDTCLDGSNSPRYLDNPKPLIMKRLFFILLNVISLAAWSQDKKMLPDPGASKRTLEGAFIALTVSDGIDVYLTQGETESVSVSASDEKFLPRFKTEVDNGVLKLYYDNKGINWGIHISRKLKAYVTFKKLEKISASGGSSVRADGKLLLENLDMKFTSGSHFDGTVDAKSLNVEQNSGSGIGISGRAERIKVECSSGSLFKGYELSVDYCDAKASSGAGVHITINKELTAKATSGGGIRYRGSALIREVNASSGGIVKKEK
jgi:hypothetical protein